MGGDRRVRWVGLFGALLCFASLAVAQDTFTITGANPDNYSMGGVYISPYQATIQNGSQTVYSGLVICDDFTDDVSVPESWTVQQSTVGSGGAGLFGSTSSAGYNEVAWLAEWLIAGGNYNDPIAASELSFAIWTVFDPSAINYVTGIGAVTAAQVASAVNADIATAVGDGTYSGPTVTVWTPTSWAAGTGRPQEFLTVATPEASLAATLGVELLTLMGVVFLMRRRLVRA